MIQKNELITIRDYDSSDQNFIFATWLKGLYYGGFYYEEVKKSLFMAKYHEKIETLLNSNYLNIKVACLKDDPGVILGYAVMSKDNKTLHWVFCKEKWRSIGIMKSLVSSEIKEVTHLTKVGLSILRKHPTLSFNPFKMEELIYGTN